MRSIRSMGGSGSGSYGSYLAKASEGQQIERDGALAGYYAKNETYMGKWLGREAETFGLAGKEIGVGDPAFENFNEGLAPDGTALGQRTITERKPTFALAHQAVKRELKREPTEEEVHARLKKMQSKGPIRFFDATASADKSFSIAAITGGDERLKALFLKSVEEVFTEAIEPLISRRVRTGEKSSSTACEITAKAIAGMWGHDLSREREAQLHAHVVLTNFTVGEDGKRYALDPQMVAKTIRRAGKLLQSKLATGARELGYRVENRVDEKGRITGFRLADITEAMEKSQSSRSRQADAAEAEFTAQNGRAPTDAERTVLVRQTASRKNALEVLTQETLNEQAEKMGKDEYMKLIKLVHGARERTEDGIEKLADVALVADKAVAAASRHLEERLQIWPRHVLEAEALNLCLGRASDADVLAAVERAVAGEKTAVLVGRHDGEHNLFRGISTPRAIRNEMFIHDRIAANRRILQPLAEFKPIDGLSPDQNGAVKFVAECRDRHSVLIGVAGAGKTQTSKGIQQALASTGKQIIVITPTTSAAEVWRGDGFTANTIESFLAKMKNPKKCNEVRNALILVDEASMVSGRVGAELTRQADRLNQRILWCGDPLQHSATEGHEMLRVALTATEIARYELKEVWRQKSGEYKRVVELMGGVARDIDGRQLPASVPAGMRALDKMGWLHEVTPEGSKGEDGKPKENSQKGGYLGAAGRRYIEQTANGTRLDDCILVSPTHAENRILNNVVRDELKTLGVLERALERKRSVAVDLGLTDSQKLDVARYTDDEFLVARGNLGKLKSGEASRILGAGNNPEGKAVLFLENGEQVVLTKRAVTGFQIAKMTEIGLCPGDRVQARQNHKEMRERQPGKPPKIIFETELINNRVYTVAEVRDNGEILTTEGKVIPSHYSKLSYGYARTSDSSQGSKAKNVVAAMAEAQGKAAYVSTSRGVERCDLYTPDKEHLLKSVARGSDKESVTEDLRKHGSSETERALRAIAKNVDASVSVMQKFTIRSGATVRNILRLGLRTITKRAQRAAMMERGRAGYVAAQRERDLARATPVPGRAAETREKSVASQRSR